MLTANPVRYSLLAVCFPWLAQAQDVYQNSSRTIPELTSYPPCDALISAGLGDRLLLATSDAYEPRVQSWFSANARYRPWCFVQPYTTQEVSTIIRTLANAGEGAGDWHIAVRSGGHSPPGTNNIASGITIDLGMMNGSYYDPLKKIASIEPGGHWKDVYRNLLQNGNVTVTGGRDGGVGVGGFLLGGGLSYHTPRNGLGCDTVINYEVVLANGSVVNANSNEHPDLYKVLKGGSLNFGIVTRFDIQAMPAVDIAYGQSIHTGNYSDVIFDALSIFVDGMDKEGDDALFAMHIYDSNGDPTILVVRTNVQGDLETTSFDNITAIPSLTSTWEHKSLADAAEGSQVSPGLKSISTTLTFLNSPSLLRHSASLQRQLISSLSNRFGAENIMAGVVYQPLPSYLSSLRQENRGTGNILGLDRLKSNVIIWNAGIAVINGDDAALAVAGAALNAMTGKLKTFAQESGLLVDFVYLNYADTNQNPLGSYGSDNILYMKEVAKKYDPDEFWQSRVPGGWKVSRVG